jgi:hypothetical protein
MIPTPASWFFQHCHVHTCEFQEEKVWSELGVLRKDAANTGRQIGCNPEVTTNLQSSQIGPG